MATQAKIKARIAAMTEMASNGWSQRRIAVAVGTTQGAVSMFMSRHNISHKRSHPTPHKDMYGRVHPFIWEIRRERIARGWTQKQLALRAGYHQSQVCEYESGQRHPPIHKVIDLVNALGGVVEVKFPVR